MKYQNVHAFALCLLFSVGGMPSALAFNPIPYLRECLSPQVTNGSIVQNIESALLKKKHPESFEQLYIKLGADLTEVEKLVAGDFDIALKILRGFPADKSMRYVFRKMSSSEAWFAPYMAHHGLDIELHENTLIKKLGGDTYSDQFPFFRDYLSEAGWSKLLAKVELRTFLKYLPYLVATGDIESEAVKGRLGRVSPLRMRFLSLATLPMHKIPSKNQRKAMKKRVEDSIYSSADWVVGHLPLGTCSSHGCRHMQKSHLGSVGYKQDDSHSYYSREFIQVFYKGEIMGSIKTKGDKTFFAWKTLVNKKSGGFSLVAGATYQIPAYLAQLARSGNPPEKVELTEVGVPANLTPLKFLMAGEGWYEDHSKLIKHLNKLIKKYE